MSIQDSTPPVPCPRCNSIMRFGLVKTAIWQGERVYLVEDIPAQICDECSEQFYDPDTADALRKLTEEGFPSVKVKREVLVPIFSLEGDLHGSNPPPLAVATS